ncbi:MAG: bifunctional helix-turn-helix domain-containing protein/methylated-DNA--[protein]-cysteine S-methyltransferase [Deltaproteobacteria bacterium]
MRSSDYRRVEQAIRYLERHARRQPTLSEVARAAGLSEYHFHRLFARWAGITPKRFLQFLTAEHAKRLLRESASLLDAAFETGLSGPGRLHDRIVNVHAVTPGELKSEGAGLSIRYGIHASPFGDWFLAVTDRGVCDLSFTDRPGAGDPLLELRTRWPKAAIRRDQSETKAVAERIFAPGREQDTFPLGVVVRGTDFQIRVWEALLRIPPGCVASYEEIAVRIGSPAAVRAVGSAVGKNPVAFLIPCHRVIRKTGAFGNYGGGPARKKAMLAWEAAQSGQLRAPVQG